MLSTRPADSLEYRIAELEKDLSTSISISTSGGQLCAPLTQTELCMHTHLPAAFTAWFQMGREAVLCHSFSPPPPVGVGDPCSSSAREVSSFKPAVKGKMDTLTNYEVYGWLKET